MYEPGPSSLITEREAARMLGISSTSLRRWRQAGRGPIARRIGPRALRYRQTDIEDFVSGSRNIVG
jgi:predicted DNA-binding transcriptional regulator AlpA